MKKIFAMLLTLIMLLCFSACGSNQNTPDEATTAAENSSATQAAQNESEAYTEPEYEDIYYEEIFGEGEYTNSLGENANYSYTVCKLRPEVPGAKDFNAEIEAVENSINEYLGAIANGSEPYYDNVSVGIYKYDGLYTILYRFGYSALRSDYEAYHFDSLNGEVLNDADFLGRLGLTDVEFTNQANKAAEKHLRTQPAGTFADLDEEIKKTKLYIDQFAMKPFVRDGEIWATVPVSSAAENDWVYEELNLGIEPGSPTPSVNEAVNRLSKNSNVKKLIDSGLAMYAMKNTERIAGKMCRVISLGTKQKDGFKSEYLFGVSDKQIYLYDAEADTWNEYK